MGFIIQYEMKMVWDSTSQERNKVAFFGLNTDVAMLGIFGIGIVHTVFTCPKNIIN